MTTATKIRLFPRLSAARVATAEARLAKLQKIREIEFLRYEDYRRSGDDWRGPWGNVTRADDSAGYGEFKEGDCPDSAGDYLRALSTDELDSGEVYFYVPFSTGSDGSGCTATRSNYLVFLERYGKRKWVYNVRGGFGTYAVAVGLTGLLTCATETADSILEDLAGLADYPLLDEEEHSRLEWELSDESWESCYAQDFARAVEGKFDGIADLELPTGDALRAFFEAQREKSNEYWYNEGYGHDMVVRLDPIVERIELDDLADWTVRYVVTFNDVGMVTEEYNVESDASERVAHLRATGFDGAFYSVVKPLTPVQKDIADSIRNGLQKD